MTENQEEIKKKKMMEQYRNTYIKQGQFQCLGNYKNLLNDYHQGEPLLTLGPNYLTFIISFLIANLISGLILVKLSQKEQPNPFFLVQMVAIIFLDIVWLATALINPGIAVIMPEDEGELCQECQARNGTCIIRKPGRVHCKDCNVCIDEYEHHLALVGGCIGKHNFIVFKLFLLGLFFWGISLITIIPIVENQ